MTGRSIQAPLSQRFVRNDTGGSYKVVITIREDDPNPKNRRFLSEYTATGFSSQPQAIEYGDSEGSVLQREAERVHKVPAFYRFVVIQSTHQSYR